ncbi:PREDICTED: putative F-box/FBD/LRR-repeat protein At5g56810 [Camelina sativa]|uniref:F-box/FBD/LRR-repeat protein At5g56810 n=1 Tax=Camelina sativa TaxID=90675 RepID=A0ABM1QJ79_CAMSA|nr:PREDICTED: putative F-box/FBD/LRR-repeat protein At5g56810 [Camelina sativa]
MSLPKASLLRNLNLKLDKKAASKVIDYLLFPNLPPTLLQISITSLSRNFLAFPKNFKVFQTLVVLKLQGTITLDAVVVSPVCFQSLKSLHLISVLLSSKTSLERLLSACPVLEDLFFETNSYNRTYPFTISVPSLQRLHITDHVHYSNYGDLKFEINAPSLKYLKMMEWSGCIKFVEDMPKLVGAKVTLSKSQAEKLIRLLTSVEFLSIKNRHPSMVLPLANGISHQLLRLKLDIYHKLPLNLLLHLLKHSPKLQVLKLHVNHFSYTTRGTEDQLPPVSAPILVPECVSFHLETFELRSFVGREEVKEVVVYILQNARHLKTASILIYSEGPPGGENDPMLIKELKSISLASKSCQLVVRV